MGGGRAGYVYLTIYIYTYTCVYTYVYIYIYIFSECPQHIPMAPAGARNAGALPSCPPEPRAQSPDPSGAANSHHGQLLRMPCCQLIPWKPFFLFVSGGPAGNKPWSFGYILSWQADLQLFAAKSAWVFRRNAERRALLPVHS